MWNSFQTDAYDGMLAEPITLRSYNGDLINAYIARPLGPGPYPSVIVTHHPTWDEFHREMTRRFAQHGYIAICPNLFSRVAHGTPDDVSAAVRAQGGISDESAIGDIGATLEYLRALPYSNGKVGVTGPCAGGRYAYLMACKHKFDAVVNLWGGNVIVGPQDLTDKRPVAVIDYTKDLSCPMLGLFGEEDQNPSPAHVAQIEGELKKFGKTYEFHSYAGAGHGFFYYDRPAYRHEQAMDGWGKIFEFFGKHLS